MSFEYIYKRMVFTCVEKRLQNFLREYEIEFIRNYNYLTLLKLSYFDRYVLYDFQQKLDTSSFTFSETNRSLKEFMGLIDYLFLFIKKKTYIDLDIFYLCGKKMRIDGYELVIYDDKESEVKRRYNFMRKEKEIEEDKKDLIDICRNFKFDIRGLDTKILVEIILLFIEDDDDELTEVLVNLLNDMIAISADPFLIEKVFRYDPFEDPSFCLIKNTYKEYKDDKLLKEEDKYKDDLSRYRGYLINKISETGIKEYYEEDFNLTKY